jgi:CDP-glucose 4,6-dehydratase
MEALGQIDRSFWRDRRVFLTGHTGFKGSWLSLMLHQLGATVAGFSLAPNRHQALFTMASVEDFLNQSVYADIRDLCALRLAIRSARPEIVVHMAAQPLVRDSYADPLTTYSTNVIGTANLLEVVRAEDSVRAVVVVTTDKVYSNQDWGWGYRESDRLGGFDPYSSSKACAELVTAAYRQSFFNPRDYGRHGVALSTARAGNVIGGGDFAHDRLVPDVFRAFAASQPVLIRNPDALRPWQHVLEPLRGYLMLAQALIERGPTVADAINFGPLSSDALPVEKIVQMLTENWDHRDGWYRQPGEHAHETKVLKLDISLAAEILGWRPLFCIEEALSMCCDWQREVDAGNHPKEATQSQIKAYLDNVSFDLHI